MTDPYRVLGVSRNASDDEIKKAYRNLSRKYHPDANVNNPNKDQAEEHFKEVQQAYDQIMKEKQQGGGYGDFGYHYGNGGSFYQEAGNQNTESNEMRAAANYIANHYYNQAMNVLQSISESERGGRWYYYSALASEGMGNLVNAKEFINRAVALEPSNFQYRQFQQHLEYGNTWYTSRGDAYERPYSGVTRWCLNLVLLNLFCNCCCWGPRMF